jgi:hypothetical protein
VEVRVPANTLFSENGTRGGKVGIAPVPADRLPEPLPPGLNLPLVITIQTDGPQNFDRPVPVRFPNLPDPVTGAKLPPGAKTVLWSFNHDTGRWEPQGTATITADGNFAETDPGVGVRQPGWHGVTPATEPERKPDPPPDPPDPPDPPEEDPCEGQFGNYDCDKDGCPETSEPCEEECEAKKKETKRIEAYCPLSRAFTETIDSFFSCPLIDRLPGPGLAQEIPRMPRTIGRCHRRLPHLRCKTRRSERVRTRTTCRAAKHQHGDRRTKATDRSGGSPV